MNKCYGVKLHGRWKGYPCENKTAYNIINGKTYCDSHYKIVLLEPKRFEKAIKLLAEKFKKLES